MSEWIKTTDDLGDGGDILILTKSGGFSSGYFLIEGKKLIGMKFNGCVANMETWNMRGIVPEYWALPPEFPKK